MDDVSLDPAEEALADLCADLVSVKAHEVFLERLFAKPAGSWWLLDELIRGMGAVELRLGALPDELAHRTRATWLDYPASTNGPGYCTVILYNETAWSWACLYNRAAFVRVRGTVN